MTEGFCQRYLELVNLSCIGKANIVEEWKLDRYQALMRTRRTSAEIVSDFKFHWTLRCAMKKLRRATRICSGGVESRNTVRRPAAKPLWNSNSLDPS